MRKKLLTTIAVLALAALLVTASFAAGFEKKTAYADGTFTDVSESAWYAKEVKSAYELGFMNGKGQGLFSPDGNVTVAEAITMASRVHASYNGKTISAETTDRWYTPYVNYAVAEGIITDKAFDNYDRNIKRYEMAEAFYNAMPESWFTKINNVEYLPDVNEMASYRNTILALYNSGVVMGSDNYGTFRPDNDITRSEAAAIINRVAIPENRLTKTLDKREAPVAPLYFIDDSGGMNMSVYGQYGWEFDQRGVPAGTSSGTIYVVDTNKNERTAMLRTFAKQTSGKIVMEVLVNAQLADNDLCLILSEDETKNAMYFITKNGNIHAKEGDKLTDTGYKLAKQFVVKTITDMDAKTNTLIVDGKLIGTYGFADSDCTAVNTLTFCGTKEGTAVATFSKTKLYTGYALNDIFLSHKEFDYLPDGWKLEGGATGRVAAVTSNAFDSCSAKISAPAGTNNILSRSFDPITRKVCFEMKFYMPKYNDGTRFALTSGGKEVVSIYTNGNAFYSGDGQKLREYNSGVWQTVRFEANTDTGIVDYSINFKRLAKGYFNAQSFDGIAVTIPGADGVEMIVDDFYVFNLFDEEPDYVPEPVPVESDKAIVGIEVCDIWRNGFQHGWDYTSAYDELYTYLGMFDEGNIEVADWETKWLLEHGVDFKLVCWYNGTPSNPLKTPRNSFGIYAQLNSKYTDMMKYAIMWENAANLPKNRQQFRDNVLAYWIEYYLYDKDRYFTIDNKALITIYKTTGLEGIFGSNAEVKAELDYIREVCKGLGYDGAIILTTSSPSDTVIEMGFDGVYSYNWGQSAFDIEYQKSKIKAQEDTALKLGSINVPTIGVGFCNMFLGQGNKRSELITPEDLESVLKWTSDEFLAKRNGETWQNDMVILSNWNEFGEGHYILPTNRIGFTYLDAIRNAYCSAPAEHEDLRPKDETRVRYNALYDQDRKRVRRYELETPDSNIDLTTLSSTAFYDFTDSATEKILRNSHGNKTTEYTGSSFKGVSEGADFAIVTTKKMGFDATEADYIRIVYKATAVTQKEKGQLFFLTEKDGNWNEKKHLDFDIISDGNYHEYYIDMSSCSAWKGKIGLIRLDPISRGNCEWEIQLIEFLDKPDDQLIYINGDSTPVATVFDSVYENGGLAAIIDPYTGFYAKLGIFYRWNYKTEEFTLYGPNDKFITYTMGSSNAKTSDGDIMLSISPKLVDGIPLIEITAMAEALGIKLEIQDNKYLLTNPYMVGEDGKTTLDVMWGFDVPGYPDGFTFACADTIDHRDGLLTMKSKTNGKRHDPVMNSPSIDVDAVKYEKVVVGMSYDVTGGYNPETTTGITSSLFFAAPGGSFNGTDVVQVTTEGMTSNGKVIEVEFDMTSNVNWDGKIGRVRFDPFEAEGTFTVDYIKILLTNPEGIKKVKPKPTTVIMDAEDPIPEGITYAGQDATISIVEDPLDPTNKVFKVHTTATTKKWAYLNIFMHFEPGKKYRVSYRIYGLKDAKGNAYENNSISGNFMYGTDGETVSNHTTKGARVTAEAKWYDCVDEYTVSADYVPSNKDCFQFWSNPINNCGVSFLVDAIKIELAE